MKVALTAAPWPLFNRPSIQVAALKAYIKTKLPEVEVRCFHPYLKCAQAIGFASYHAISQSSFASEAVGAALLFPEMFNNCEKIFTRNLAKRGTQKISFQATTKRLKETLLKFIKEVNWNDYQAVGFTVCLNQLTTSLWLAKEIKKINPACKVILGGSSCSGRLGRSLLDNFGFIDYAINGEGEKPLASLLTHLNGNTPKIGEKTGILTKGSNPAFDNVKNQIKDINSLPIPDFDDYFSELAGLDPQNRFFPELPIEFSRGCWWRRCTFCNLNLQWENYRQKTHKRMAQEIDHLAQRYGVLDFAFMDNALPKAKAPQLFKLLSKHERDYHFFAEIRAAHTRKEMAHMSRAGLKEVQVGIEALSTSLLKRLSKGTKAFDNIAAMRHALEAGISLQGNLILHFPGSTEEEVAETLANIEYVWPFQPLKTVSFWLGYGSPVQQDHKKFKISGIKPHHYFADLFPKGFSQNMVPMVLEYRGDKKRQQQLWKAVETKVHHWQREWEKLIKERPLLSYRDGGNFMIIRQVLPGGRTLYHRLTGASKALYLLAADACVFQDLEAAAPKFSPEQIRAFVHQMVEKKLMFCEGQRIISLAVKDHRNRNI